LKGIIPFPDVSFVNWYNTSLKSLQFGRFRPADLVARTDALLSQIALPNIKKITLIFDVYNMEELEITNWHTFAQTLSLPQLPHLRTIQLLVDAFLNIRHRTQARDIIKAKLAECGAREIILVELNPL
jgi:hypothetical protein